MGDILGGGFILALAGFSVAMAGTESGAPYAQLGASRAMTFGALIEPTILFVVFAVALITSTDLPYALAATVRSSSSEMVRPATSSRRSPSSWSCWSTPAESRSRPIRGPSSSG